MEESAHSLQPQPWAPKGGGLGKELPSPCLLHGPRPSSLPPQDYSLEAHQGPAPAGCQGLLSLPLLSGGFGDQFLPATCCCGARGSSPSPSSQVALGTNSCLLRAAAVLEEPLPAAVRDLVSGSASTVPVQLLL